MGSIVNDVFVSAFACSALVCGVVTFSQPIHARFTSKADADTAIQSAHEGTTPRIGGLGLLVALLVASWAFSAHREATFMLKLVVASLPLFVGGLLDDLGVVVRPVVRLTLAFVSAALMSAFTGIWLTDLSIEWVNRVLAVAPVAVFFTAFATAGVSNAFNIIDGLNGLASGTGIIVSAVLAALAFGVEDMEIALSSLAMCGGLFGFFVWNFPKGRLFLGDCGAYFTGFFLSWLAVLLVERHDSVSPWALLVVFAYPITETVFTIFRRKLNNQSTLNAPDQEHLHSIVFIALGAKFEQGLGLTRRNSLAAILMLTPTCLCAWSGMYLAWSSLWSQVGYVVFFLLYALAYRVLSKSIS